MTAATPRQARHRALLTLPPAFLLAAACHHRRPPAPEPEPQGNHCYEEPFAPNVRPDEAISLDEFNAVAPWLQATIGAMQSGTSLTVLEALAPSRKAVWLSLEAGTRTLPELGKLLRRDDGLGGSDPWWTMAVLRLEGAAERDASSPDGFEAGSRPDGARYAGTEVVEQEPPGGPTVAIRVGRVHLERWRSEDVVERSCAVNVLAHELVHTFSRSSRAYRPFFADTGSGAPEAAAAIASTLVETLAQCRYLQEAKRVADGLPALEKCLETFGAQPFPSARCDDFADATREIDPSAAAAPTATPSHGVLPTGLLPLVVLSSDPAHCPADAPAARGSAVTSLGQATQCIRFETDGKHLQRIVLAPTEQQDPGRKKTRYRMCVSEVGERPKGSSKPGSEDRGAPVDFALSLADLPDGKPLWIENASRWRKGDPDAIALPCEGKEPLVIVKAGRGEALPRRADRTTGQVLGRGH